MLWMKNLTFAKPLIIHLQISRPAGQVGNTPQIDF